MRILHLLANWKWTGPAEPALQIACAQRDAGHDVVFACGTRPKGDEAVGIVEHARERRMEPWLGLHLDKHWRPWRNLQDRRRLTERLAHTPVDVLHTHTQNDHRIASAAARALPRGIRPVVVRTSHDGVPLVSTWRLRGLMTRGTDGYAAVSKSALAADDATFGFTTRGIPAHFTEPLIDTDRFSPRTPDAALLAEAEIKPGAFIGGIVARMQRHRRFEVLIDALKIVCAQRPEFRFLLVGRGTYREQVVDTPLRESGLMGRVQPVGYRSGDALVAAISTFAMQVFLMPGSDGSCRAVREAMAMGVPVLAARRGMLPELIEDGVTGWVVDDTAENLARVMIEAASDPAKTAAMGKAARKAAEDRFAPANQVRALDLLYREVIAKRRVAW
jgi:glycosyltransferase involved in cell wall biosynthesis